MKGIHVGLLTAVLLAGCATGSADRSRLPWDQCARSTAMAWLERGIPTSWPAAASLPADAPLQSIALGAHPPGVIYDAFYRTLHLDADRNAVYVEQTGGIAGVHDFYGPVSLEGECKKLSKSSRKNAR